MLPLRKWRRPLSPADYDAWYVYSKGDKPFRSLHATRERQADGSLRYTVTTRTLVDFLGQRQEMLRKFECATTDTLGPRSCRLESRGQSGVLSAEGHVEGEELVLAFAQGEAHFERRISLAKKPIFSSCLADELAARSDTEGEITLHVIDVDSWLTGQVTAKRLADVGDLARWEVASETIHDLAGTWLLQPDGTLDRVEETDSIVLRRATLESAAQLEYFTYADRDLLMFPLDRDLPFPERLRSITVRLRWQDTNPEMLQLEDAHQQIVRQNHDGKDHEVVLRLTRPVDVASPVELPVSDPKLARYLEETHFVRPRDESIHRQAMKWTEGATTTLEAAGKLSHEVWNYLDGGELVAETLSGPEVLACRKGKCSEYSTLFASLARSVGVPTRIALGMRLVGGRWVGHMWCEAWVGQWIPLDASADEVGGSPALLKLTHSDTVLGTQAARWAVAKTLEISVVDVERDRQRPSHLTTGIVRERYTNADFLCRITAPSAEWRLEDKSTPGVATIRFRPPPGEEGGKAPLVHFVAFGLPAKIGPQPILAGRRAHFASQYKDFKVLAEGDQMVGADAGRRLEFVHQVSQDKTIKTTEILWTHGRSGYLLNLIADEQAHDAVLKQFEALLGSFELLPSDE